METTLLTVSVLSILVEAILALNVMETTLLTVSVLSILAEAILALNVMETTQLTMLVKAFSIINSSQAICDFKCYGNHTASCISESIHYYLF